MRVSPAQSTMGQSPPMGFLGTSERLMEQWTTSLWRNILPASQEQGEALTTFYGSATTPP